MELVLVDLFYDFFLCFLLGSFVFINLFCDFFYYFFSLRFLFDRLVLDDFLFCRFFFDHLVSRLFLDGLVLLEYVIAKQGCYCTLNLSSLLICCLFKVFFDFVVDNFIVDNFFFNFLNNLFCNGLFYFFYGLFNLFYNLDGFLLGRCLFCDFLCNRLFLSLNFDGLLRGLGKHLDRACFLTYLCLGAGTEITLGVMTLGCANGFVCGGCGGGRSGSCGSFFYDGLLLNNRFFFYYRFFNNRLFLNNLFNSGLIVINLPSKVCICGNDGFVLLCQLRYVVGIELKGSRRLFLTQILTDQAAGNKRFGIGKGILLLVIDLLDVDRRKPLLFASTLYQLKGKRELAGRVDLVKEGGFGIFLLAADVASAINGILQCGRLERQIQVERTGTDINFCNLRVFVCIGINGPTHALFCAFVAHECIADGAVILFGSRT